MLSPFLTLPQVEMHFKDQFAEVFAGVNVLPMNTTTPFSPFTSCIININCKTKSHRDTRDFEGCLVLPIGKFEGGELCLKEPRISIKARPGDMIVFDSVHYTHFNRPYSGERGSLVLHADSAIKSFITTNARYWAKQGGYH